MRKRQIARLTGHVVAHCARSGDNVAPARILDGRLWEQHADGRFVLSERDRAYRSAELKVGYPVLTVKPGIYITAKQWRELERFLVNTTLTIGDLVENERENFLGEIEGVIFRVVFPGDLFENYPRMRREQIASKRAHMARLKAEEDRFSVLRDQAVELSNILAGVGADSPDNLPIVSPRNVQTSRVSVPVDVLAELVRLAVPLMEGCRVCRKRDPLFPHYKHDKTVVMLCGSCHPRIH